MASSSSLLDMPREIRDMIYRSLLIKSWPKYRLQLRKSSPYTVKNLDLSIFRVNRQIFAESTEVFYGENHFDWGATESVLKTIADYQLARLRDARFLWSHDMSPLLVQQWKRKLEKVWKSGNHVDGVKLDQKYHGGIWIRAEKHKEWIGGPMFGMI